VTYLDKVGATYYFRRAVPLDVRAYFLTSSGRQRVDWKETLRTKDRRIATERCNLRAVETDNEIRDARAKLRAGIPPAHGLTAAMPPPAKVAAANLTEEEIQSAEVMDRYWREHDAEVEADPVRQQIADAVHEDRVRQDRERAAAAELLAEVRKQKAVPLMDLFDAYVAERQPAPATIKRWRPVMDHMIAFVGHDDAARITRPNVVAWKDDLLGERLDGEPVRKARTVKETYVASLSVVLGYGRENGLLKENVASDVIVRVPKTVRLRDPGFTKDEALTILRATMQPQPTSLAPEHRLARRWIPWLCAYTGARVGEMAQLRAEDVTQMDGVWAVRITPEAGSTKSGNARIVPLHPHLIEQGFPEVAAAKGEGPLFYNPARGRGGEDGNPHYKKIGERIGAWVRKLGIAGVQPNHAWRHLFKTNARLVRMDPEAREAIPGHAQRTEGEKYGVYPLPILAEELAKLPRFAI
jgi:integrase